MSLSQAKEKLSTNTQETIKVSELSEHGIDVPKELLSKYGETLLEKSKVEQLYTKKTAEEQQNALRGLLGLRLEVSKKALRDVERSQKHLYEIKEKGVEESNESRENSEKILEGLNEQMNNIVDSEQTEKFKEGASKLAQKSQEGIENISKTQAVKKALNWIKDLFEKFIGFFGLDKFFDFGEKVEKAKEALSEEQIEETREEIINNLTQKYPEKKEQITQVVNSHEVNEKNLETIYNKIQAGEEIKLSDITPLFPNLKNIFSKEELEKTIEQYKQKAVLSVKKTIEEKYPGVEITGDKLNELERLVIKYFNLSDENALLVNHIIDNREFKFKDSYALLFEGTAKGTGFSLSLISKGIVPISAIGIDILDNGLDIAKISLSWIGITEKISFDELVKQIGDVEHPELLLGLLYRKGGLLFSIIGDLAEHSSRLAIEAATQTNVSSYNLGKNSILGKYYKQAGNFKKLAESMGDYSDEGTGLIKKSTENLKQIEKNYKAINIVQKHSDDISKNGKLPKKLLNELRSLGFEKLTDDIDDIKKLTIYFDKNFNLPFKTNILSKQQMLNKFAFGGSADFYELTTKFEKISRSQKAFFDSGILKKGLFKMIEFKNAPKVSRLSDKLIYNFDSVSNAKDFAKKLKILSNKAPNLIGSMFDKLPIITVAGLAMTKENTAESLAKDFMCLVPFVGPVMMIGEGGIKQNPNTNEIEIISPVEASMGGVLIGLDSMFFTKELIKDGVKGGLKYLIKPISDVYSIGKGSIEGAYNIGQLAKSGAGGKEILKEAAKRTNGLKGKVKAIGLLAILGYLGYEYLLKDDEDLKKFFTQDGILNKEKLQSEISTINNYEKEIILQYLISEKHGKKVLNFIDINIEDNKLSIKSKNKEKVANDWFIDNNMLNLLQIESNGIVA